uniref:Uncharacterized protein n=1 Tax=Percolomonas cosmopolitus TaxID=63605 RepID=A0A7S1KSB3_9EUKA
MTPQSSLPPLQWSLARTLTRLCHQYDKSPHLKSLLKSPIFTSNVSEAMRGNSAEFLSYYPYGAATGNSSPNQASPFSTLERTIIKQVYQSDQQIFYKPINRSFTEILRRVWRKPAEDEQIEHERLDAAFTFIRILNQNLMRERHGLSVLSASELANEEVDKDDRENFYEQLFGDDTQHESTAAAENIPRQSVEGSDLSHTTTAQPSLSTYNIQLLNSTADLKPGTFLVSHPLTREGVFYKTIIYLSEHHDKQGTVGFTINKSTSHMGMRAALGGRHPSAHPTTQRSGGPVVSGKHRIVKQNDGKVSVIRTGNPSNYSKARLRLQKKQSDEDKVPSDQIDKEIVFVNSTEWTSGQLESEIERGSWFLCSADVDLMFDKADSGEALWDELMTTLGGEFQDFVRVHRRSKMYRKKPRRSMHTLSL